MKIYLMLLPILISIILESTFILSPLTLFTIVALAVVLPGNLSFILAFFLGIILDIALSRPLALDSLFFLTAVLIVSLYRKKIIAQKIAYLLPYSLILLIINNYFFYKTLNITTLLFLPWCAFIYFLVFFLVNLIRGNKNLKI